MSTAIPYVLMSAAIAVKPQHSIPDTKHAQAADSAHVPSTQVYKSEATPVEEHFRSKGRLMTFEITGGIPETLPRLLDALRPYSALTEERKAFNSKQRQLQALQQTAATSQSGASVENLQAASAGAV